MRITNNDSGPLEVIAELFSYQRFRRSDTSIFAHEDWRNHDWLLERLGERIDVVLESFRRLGCDIHETQSLRDHGVDLRLRIDFNGKSRVIGIQVKSNNEAEKDRNRAKHAETLAGTLKRQAYEAMAKASVDEWWILLCFDKTKHARRISSICAELLGDNSKFDVTIFQPEKALSLLRMSEGMVDAVCTRLLCSDDEVLNAAISEANDLSPAALEVILSTLDAALHGKTNLNESDIFDAIENNAQDESDVVSELDDCGYAVWNSDRSGYLIEPGAMMGLCSLYFEGRVRHSLSRNMALEFVSQLVRPRKAR